MYVELHCHSAFSFLDGASQPDELVATAAALGYEALALTDHDGLSGAMEHAQAAKALGVRAIHGAEVTVLVPPADVATAPAVAGLPAGSTATARALAVRSGRTAAGAPPVERHLTLLVQDATGWANLCRLLTLAHADTRGTPGEQAQGARRDARPPSLSLDAVLDHAEGLVCLSGCAEHGVHDARTLRRLRDAFGPDRLRVELSRPFARHDRARNRALTHLARELGLRCVATGDVHAHARHRAPLQDAFVALRHGSTLDASEPLRRGNFAHVLASPEAMAARFADHPDAVAETVRVADRLRFDLTQDLGYRYPGAEEADAGRRLVELCDARFDTRYPDGHALRATAKGRLEEELRVIDHLGLPGFFLLHHELLELAREVAADVRGPAAARSLLPPGRGRGSSVSSIVCYLTGLSHIDPVANELFLGRFLNEEITALPDIDLDFPRDIRAELIPRIHRRYGNERSALVAAFPTFKARSSIRELGKVLGLPPGEIERVARGAEPFGTGDVERDIRTALGSRADEVLGPARPAAGPDPSWREPDPRERGAAPGAGDMIAAGIPGAQAAHGGSGGAPDPTSRWGWLVRLAREAYGLPRHLSQHSGGMIVATRPLLDVVPLVPAAMEGRQLCAWDKDSCADAGFLKIDLLGLGMLSAVERCVESIAEVRGERVDLSRIPFDDRATYAAIQEADTMGVFQIESRAQMGSLRRTRPETLDDLTVQVAIVRPGPIVGGAVNPYIARREAMRRDPDFQVPYAHPSLEPVLRDTLGTIIFQDQVIEVAMAFAGFSPGQAEGLRRAMSRKRSAEAIEAHREAFIAGAARTQGVDRQTAEQVYAMIAGFAGFGFPKAHGAAFGLLAYQSTWLRVHFPAEFLCSLLNEQPMGFYPPDTLAREARRRGVPVVGVDVNRSDVLCTVHAAGGGMPTVRIGLGYVSGVREDEVRALQEERERSGPYRSVADLASRAGIGRPALERLAWAGACDALVLAAAGAGTRTGASAAERALARRNALWQLGVAAPGRRIDAGTQLALPLDTPDAPELRALDPWEAMVADFSSTGLTLGDHPVKLLRPHLAMSVVSTRQLAGMPHGSTVSVGGLVVARQRPGTANGIVFILVEDEFGTLNLVVPPDVYERCRLAVRSEPLLLAHGRLERRDEANGEINVVVRDIRALDAPGAEGRVVELAERAARARGAQPGEAAEAAEQPALLLAGGGGGAPMAVGGFGNGSGPGVAATPGGHVGARASGEGAAAAGVLADFRGVAPSVQSFAQGRRR